MFDRGYNFEFTFLYTDGFYIVSSHSANHAIRGIFTNNDFVDVSDMLIIRRIIIRKYLNIFVPSNRIIVYLPNMFHVKHNGLIDII